MNRAILVLALALIAVGVVGLVVVGYQSLPQTLFGNPQGYGFPGGMMRGRGYGYAPNATPLSVDQAVTRAQQYVASLNNADLAVVEVMEFSDNLYARVIEKSTGVNAFEILIDRYNGAVSPEPGPNMMWNARYSPMSRMMGGWFASNAQNTLTPAQARETAQQYLDTYYKGAKVADDADAFYGYYTIDVLRDGKTVGMLSVNGATGAVWYHTWHGSFISEKEIK